MARDLGLLVLRLCGLYMAFGHGWGKVMSLSSGQGTRLIEGVGNLGFPAPVVFAWAAALSEFLGGLLVAFGLGTRYAAAFTAFTMFVAAFLQHHAASHFLSWLGVAPVADDVRKGWGNPELAFTYMMLFLGVALLGPGAWSLDALIARRRR